MGQPKSARSVKKEQNVWGCYTALWCALRVSRCTKSCLYKNCGKKVKTKGKKSIDFPLLPVKYLFVKFPSPLLRFHSWQAPPPPQNAVCNIAQPSVVAWLLHSMVSLLRLVYSDNWKSDLRSPPSSFYPPRPDCLLSSFSVNQWLLK